MKKSFSILLLLVPLLLTGIISCHKRNTLPDNLTWDKYSYEDYDGFLYVTHFDEKVTGILCFNYIGLQGYAKLEHACTEEQFKDIRKNITENLNADFLGTSEKPDLTEYPDLSAYINFVVSSDELHEIWQELGLEKNDE